MSEHKDEGDERNLRSAFARLRNDEAPRAPTLAELVARANREDAARVPRLAWLRLALPLTGAAMTAFAWWISASAPQPAPPAARPPLIALGSLQSPTDALLASPLASLPRGFSGSLIPSPSGSLAAPANSHSRAVPARRFPA